MHSGTMMKIKKKKYLAEADLAIMIDTVNEVIAQARLETWFSEHG